MHDHVLEKLDRAILTCAGWSTVLVPDGEDRVPVWVPPGLSSRAVDLWLKCYRDLPVWGEDRIPRFTSDPSWAEELRLGLIRRGYSVTLESCPRAVRCRVLGPVLLKQYGCKTTWLDRWPGPGAPGPVTLGLAVYHAFHGAEMLAQVEELLAA